MVGGAPIVALKSGPCAVSLFSSVSSSQQSHSHIHHSFNVRLFISVTSLFTNKFPANFNLVCNLTYIFLYPYQFYCKLHQFKMIRLIFLILVINISSQFPVQRSVMVQEVKLQCQREVTSKIICTLPSDADQNSILEITEAFSYIKRDLTDMEVKYATEVDISDKFMPINMPLEIGKNFPKLEALWVVKSNIKFIKKNNFAKKGGFKSSEFIRKSNRGYSCRHFYGFTKLRVPGY